MIVILNFQCTVGTRLLTFFQDIEEVNNYAPEFLATSYEILIPTPLPPNLDATIFMLVTKV